MEYYERIRALREDRDITQEQMSKILSISQQTLSQYETNRRTLPIDMLKKIAEYFEVSADYILGITDEQKERWGTKNITNINNKIKINGDKNKININNEP